MQIEYADLSLIGDREENQDRVAVIDGDDATLLIAVDGMGGHSDGARAAELAIESIGSAFSRVSRPLLDPQGFLHRALGRAHDALVNLGTGLGMDARPRATCAMALVQDDAAFWAHVGDSRVYQLRTGQVQDRTRDHSHVELLLQEGLITEEQIAAHPMRNYVECCLGGGQRLPGMSVSRRKRLRPGDLVLVCTDGFWSGLDDFQIASLSAPDIELATELRRLGEQAVRATGPYSDNTSVAALRFCGA